MLKESLFAKIDSLLCVKSHGGKCDFRTEEENFNICNFM